MSLGGVRSTRFFCIVTTLISFIEGIRVGAFQLLPSEGLAGPWRHISMQQSKHYRWLASSDENSKEDQFEKLTSIDYLLGELGASFKSKAREKGFRAKKASTKKGKIMNALLSSLYYLLFFIYRAYRGFFVILPEVFKRVYAKLETALEDYADEGSDEKPQTTETVSWRTRLTVSICAIVFTGSYAVGGSIEMIKTFIRAALNTKSLPDSLGAVAEAMDGHRDEGNSKTVSSANDGLLP